MACSTIYTLLMVTVIYGCIVESRPQNFDLLNTAAGNKNQEWKNHKSYAFKWEGAFSLGAPEHSKCPMVMQPEHGRFVCSEGTLLERNMCLVECQIGFEQDQPPVVYICENGKWFDLKLNNIDTPEPRCVPKPTQVGHFPE
ncbi:uncharacterized protein [Clytia hemisphaerica]|uniref:Uncharacterized protein n=2 Tax=Clytia hemisphaerica TaxID=252671 RepID=A0A7M5V9W8_9CNID